MPSLCVSEAHLVCKASPQVSTFAFDAMNASSCQSMCFAHVRRIALAICVRVARRVQMCSVCDGRRALCAYGWDGRIIIMYT